MTPDQTVFLPYPGFWIGLVAVVVALSWYGRYRSAGLVLAYCFQLWLFYWLPAVLHCLPWSDLPERDVTFLGFIESTYALGALVVGTVVAPRLCGQLSVQDGTKQYIPDPQLPGAYISAGLFTKS